MHDAALWRCGKKATIKARRRRAISKPNAVSLSMALESTVHARSATKIT
jgi:hypothetical protein